MGNKRDEYRNSLRYNTETPRRTVNNRPTTRARYKSDHKMRNRIIALALAAGVAIPLISYTKDLTEKSEEQKYISNFKEIQEYDMTAQDLQMTQEEYEKAIAFYNEINGLELSSINNAELAEYFNKLADINETIIKEKISNITGMSKNSFSISGPVWDGVEAYTSSCILKQALDGYGRVTNNIIGDIHSDEIDGYLNDVKKARENANVLINGNVNRKNLEKNFRDLSSNAEEVMTLNLVKEMKKDGKLNVSSYRIQTADLSLKIQAAGRNMNLEIEK